MYVVDGDIHTLMVTSASKGEGKTVTSLNLAIAMALDGKSVYELIEAETVLTSPAWSTGFNRYWPLPCCRMDWQV